MFRALYEICPLPGNDDYGSAKGAFVNCFIYTEYAATAEWKATKYLKENLWEVVRVDEGAHPTNRNEYKDQNYLDCYNEALEVGHSYVFHLWPASIFTKIRIYLQQLLS